MQPAYHLMLGHIRSETLERFKAAFEDSLNGGKGFAMAARSCTESFMTRFNESCAGIPMKLYDSSM